jgi:hypothetical protein
MITRYSFSTGRITIDFANVNFTGQDIQIGIAIILRLETYHFSYFFF